MRCNLFEAVLNCHWLYCRLKPRFTPFVSRVIQFIILFSSSIVSFSIEDATINFYFKDSNPHTIKSPGAKRSSIHAPRD